MAIKHLLSSHVRTLCGAEIEHTTLKSRFPLRHYRPLGGDRCAGCTVDGVTVGRWYGKPDGEVCRVVAVGDGVVPETHGEAPRRRVEVVHGDVVDVDMPSDGQGTLF